LQYATRDFFCLSFTAIQSEQTITSYIKLSGKMFKTSSESQNHLLCNHSTIWLECAFSVSKQVVQGCFNIFEKDRLINKCPAVVAILDL
jgi:hypothetical protein